jgi:hypothetical protein
MELLQRVLSSRTFAKSVKLAKFLEFICLRTLEGKARELNEQQIGIHVFSRSPAYSASDDSIVRTQARLLRQRLDEFFEHECPTCPLIITIPKGGYVPVFETKTGLVPSPIKSLPHDSEAATVASEHPEPLIQTTEIRHQDRPPESIPRKRSLTYTLYAIVAAALILVAMASYFWIRNQQKGPSGRLWSSIFTPNRPVVIVASDDALVLYEELIQGEVPLDEYLSGSYLEKVAPKIGIMPLTPDWFASHQYTSSADLNLAMRLGRLPEATRASVETRNARVLRMEDLKSRNVILIGGIGANPWVGLFSQRLTFDVNYDWKTSQGYVLNKHPAKGEAPIYRDTVSADGFRHSYGVLAFLPGIEDDGQALLFEGTGMAGTESAADFPFNPTSFRNFIREIGAGSGKMPYFEALLETTSVGGNAPEARLVAYRIIQP